MYSDLFDALGGGNAGSGGNNAGGRGNNNNENNENESNNKSELSFHAGKMELALQENGNYLVTPDTRRCQVNLKYTATTGSNGRSGQNLIWEWYDRREKKVLDTIPITNPIKLRRVDVPKSQDSSHKDYVYYWKHDHSEYKMIWLQDKEQDPDLIDKANAILRKPIKQAEIGEANNISAPSPGNASTSSVSTTTRQVDALSNILENLGMPQQQGSGDSGPAAAASSGGATLTLADLQNAMGGVQQQQSRTQPPGLNEIVTSDAITELLENESVRQRLLEQLPEEQRSAEFLEENLRSPQIQQTLRALTAALLPDDNGSMDGYHSVLANFQLDANAGQQAILSGQSPIQAFLDCVLASVEKEKDDQEDEGKEEETKNEDDEMKDD